MRRKPKRVPSWLCFLRRSCFMHRLCSWNQRRFISSTQPTTDHLFYIESAKPSRHSTVRRRLPPRTEAHRRKRWTATLIVVGALYNAEQAPLLIVTVKVVEVRRKPSPQYKDMPPIRSSSTHPLSEREMSGGRGVSNSRRYEPQRYDSRRFERSRSRDGGDHSRGRQAVARGPNVVSKYRPRDYYDEDGEFCTFRHAIRSLCIQGDSTDSSTSSSQSSRSSKSRKSRRKPCGPVCSSHPDGPRRKRSPSPPPSPRNVRNHTLLYGALATCATIGAANTFYQSTKARRLRNNDMRDTEMCEAEEKRRKQNGLLVDIFNLGVIAVGINNVRLGWNRYNAIRRQGKHG